MSRTNKGSKGDGYEYWSRRPGNRFGGVIGPAAKKFTHGIERQQARAAVGNGLKDDERWHDMDAFDEWEIEQATIAYLRIEVDE